MKVRLGDIGKIITGTTPSTSNHLNFSSNDIFFIKPSDFKSEKLNIISQSEHYISECARNKARIVPPGSVLVTCIGEIGKVAINETECAFNQQINAIIPDQNICNSIYLGYAIQSIRNILKIKANAPVVPILNKTQFSAIEIDIPSMPIQNKVIKQLQLLDKMSSAKECIISKLDQLVKSRFMEMFGELNIKYNQCAELGKIAEITSGITKGRAVNNLPLIEVPYMAVSNVKEGYIDRTTIKTIFATKQEIERYKLLPYDVLMTEGGDPDKLGRGAIITEPPDNCIHQNHIFRIRLNRDIVHPVFYSEYLQTRNAKCYFLRCAKQTTGIATINMRQLNALPVPLPPLPLQQQFAAFVEKVDKSKLAVKQSLEKLETLKKSLMQQYFG